MRKKLTRKFLPVIIAAVLLITLVPLVSAYESHMLNVKVHVESYNFTKTIRLAEGWEIVNSGINFPSPPHGADNLTDPFNVPINTCVVWVVRITIINQLDYCMTEVVVKDHFGAELGAQVDESAVDLHIKTQTRGKSKKHEEMGTENFTRQHWFEWYVTYDGGDPPPPDPADWSNGGLLCPGEEDYIELYVWTQLNPSGKQSYTSSGWHEFNSGPNAKWIAAPPEGDGHQYSACAPPLDIYVSD